MHKYPEHAKAIFQAVVLICISDGTVAESEKEFLLALREKHPLFASLQDPKGLAAEIRDKMAEKGVDACLEELVTRIPDRDYQELCFRLCAEMMEADANAGAEEADALGTLQILFGFSAADVKRLLEGADLAAKRKS
ncbi:MAG TPA: hypothetical protein VMV18_14055 [bacterium]|nr:hypothetical protein [bacterium]